MRKKIIIIGAGVSGLSAGIYAQKNDFDSLIIEKNHFSGGNLTGWKRNGCYIDNCIHWLNGSKNGTELNKIWNEVGAFKDIEFYQIEDFYVSEFENDKISLNKDINVTHKKMLELSPDDSIEIEKFISATKLIGELGKHKGLGFINLLFRIFLIYKNKTLKEVANNFKHPLLKKLLTDYIIEEYSIYTLLCAYASFVRGDGKVLKNGSLKMAKNISDKYLSLGGDIKYNSSVDKIIIENNKAIGVKLQTGENIFADYVICCTDPNVAFKAFLPNTRLPKRLEKMYKDKKNYPIISSFHIAYKVNNNINIPETFVFEASKEIKIGATNYKRIMIRSYDYGNNFTNDNSYVLQVFLLQRSEDFDAWQTLSKEDYKKEKQRITDEITKEIINRYPEINLDFLDCWTPLSYTKYFGAYKGSYMSFGITKNYKFSVMPFRLPNIKQLYFASQWQKMFGGLPNALLSGKNCIQEICKIDRI